MTRVDGREITIDFLGARWAYSVGFWHRELGCPFIDGTPHAVFWSMGANGRRFPHGTWNG